MGVPIVGEMPSGPFSQRTFGVLLHPSSFPGREGIGTLGPQAVSFLDWLATSGAGIWQVLPLTLNRHHNLPYFAESAYAGNIWLIDLGGLVDAGLLGPGDLGSAIHDHRHADPVHFEELRARKLPLLRSAADRLLGDASHPWRAAFDDYRTGHDWLADTCWYFALSEHFDEAPWWAWPPGVKRRDPDALAALEPTLAPEVARWQAMLFMFDIQWREVRRAAADRDIIVLGDLPIYVAAQSADVWLHQDQFDLDADGRMKTQSGVPPDYFSATGQLWRNPLYRWDVMADDGFAWWLSRLNRCLELTDVVRIDHFRALAAYWEVPGDAETALGGRWVDGPGQDFLDAVNERFPSSPLVAEDLGTLDDAVHVLRDRNGLPGMRVLQFGFDGTPDNPHLPDRFTESCIAYTGTHDNQPIAAWWLSLDGAAREQVGTYYQHGAEADPTRATWSFIEAAFGSRAIAAIVPVQDLLVLGDDARMNDPSSPAGNWRWRMPVDALTPELAWSLRRLGDRYRRLIAARPGVATP
jgi:4-alpha-glucanotransferase